MIAVSLAVIYFITFFKLLEIPERTDGLGDSLVNPEMILSSEMDTVVTKQDAGIEYTEVEYIGDSKKLSGKERFKLILSLWPYTFPLFLVYISEYILQAGVWSAMGFPVDEKDARTQFYTFSNMAYQVGVFFSRTSGVIWNPGVFVLWLMPLFQCFLLIFFSFDAVHMFWYDNSLLSLCLVVGFFGGAVYVNAYKHISTNTPANQRELAIAGASIADTLGITFASILSLVVQSCLFQKHNLPDAAFKNVC